MADIKSDITCAYTLKAHVLTLHRLLIAPFEEIPLGILLKGIVRQPARFGGGPFLYGEGRVGGDEDVAERFAAHDFGRSGERRETMNDER